jgi:hypothetical protein
MGCHNPTHSPLHPQAWLPFFSWPTSLIDPNTVVPNRLLEAHQLCDPPLAFVAPVFGSSFYFKDRTGALRLKEPSWFLSERVLRIVPDEERGTLSTRFVAGIRLSQVIERFHFVGLVHADLSSKSFLLDLKASSVCLIFDESRPLRNGVEGL